MFCPAAGSEGLGNDGAKADTGLSCRLEKRLVRAVQLRARLL